MRGLRSGWANANPTTDVKTIGVMETLDGLGYITTGFSHAHKKKTTKMDALTQVVMCLKRRCVMFKFLQLLVFAMVIGLPAAGFAQFSDKADHVEVKKGTRLCSSIGVEGIRGTFDQRPIFWKVTSPMRVNGTQAVSALVHETVYDRKSGDTTTVENAYDEDFATFFKRAPEHKGMLQMISPQDGSLQAIVAVCQKEK